MSTVETDKVTTPDSNSNGFATSNVDPLRYDGQPNDAEEVVGRLCSLIPAGARVLDIGCGTGSVSRHIIDNCKATLIGFEPDAMRAALAAERGIDVRQAFLTSETLATLGKFDAVVFADVLEHVPDPLSLVNLVKTALNPGGAVIMSVPNIAHWSVRTDLLRGRFRYQDCGIMDATHLRWFTRETVEFFFKSANMRVEKHLFTAGYELRCYFDRKPWKWISYRYKRAIVRRSLKRWPALFGCQHVVRAVPI